jgi:hypothetical protein
METESYFKISVNGHQTTRCHIPEHGNLYTHRRHNLKFRFSLSLAEAWEETISWVELWRLCVCSKEIRCRVLRSYEKRCRRKERGGGRIYYLSERGRRENVSCQNSRGMLIFSDIDSGSNEGKHNFEFKGELHTDNQNPIANLILAYLTTLYQMHQLHFDW